MNGDGQHAEKPVVVGRLRRMQEPASTVTRSSRLYPRSLRPRPSED